MKRALFIVSDQGNGHRVRCSALSDELRARGWECETRLGHGGMLGYDLSHISEGEITHWPDVVILDIQAVGAPKFEVAYPPSKHFVMIVDVPRGADGADLLVCGGAWATPEAFADCGARKVLAGPEYALLRPEFRQVAYSTVGAAALAMGCKCGGIFDARNIEGKSAGELALDFDLSSVVISFAGMRALEAACIGVPLVLVSRNEGERLNAEALTKVGAAMRADEKAAEVLAKSFVGDYALSLPRMSAAGRATVDGLGCSRVADAIEEML